MASPAAPLPNPTPPPPEPQAIRACLTPALAAEFDREWDIVLERAKQSQDPAGVHDLLAKWRHTAYMEMRDPGSHDRMVAKAEQILRTGHNPDAPMSYSAHPIFARCYAEISPAGDKGEVIEHRRRLLAGLTGEVIEIGAGNGLNFVHYPDSVTRVVAIEPEPHLCDLARRAALLTPVQIEVLDGVADHLSCRGRQLRRHRAMSDAVLGTRRRDGRLAEWSGTRWADLMDGTRGRGADFWSVLKRNIFSSTPRPGFR